MGGVIDRGEPAEIDRENYNQKRSREEGGDGKANHRDECARLVEGGVLFVGRVNADGNGDEERNHIGKADDP